MSLVFTTQERQRLIYGSTGATVILDNADYLIIEDEVYVDYPGDSVEYAMIFQDLSTNKFYRLTYHYNGLHGEYYFGDEDSPVSEVFPKSITTTIYTS